MDRRCEGGRLGTAVMRSNRDTRSDAKRLPTRKALIPIVAVLVLVLVFAVATAGNTSPVATDQHPFVGTWLFDTDGVDPSDAPDVVRVSADGGYISVNAAGLTTLGVWKASGRRS